MSEKMSPGVEIIADERARQMSAEGWTGAHDDTHTADELARAAAVYAAPDLFRRYQGWTRRSDAVPADWPWDASDWKPTPKNRIKELAKAGALIAAEIDRLLRQVGS